MNAEFEQVKEIFLAALERATPDAREAYLSQACAANEPLRRQVDALLHRHEQAGSFLESPPSDFPSPGEEGEGPAVAATYGQPITERPGAVIGPYKLLEQIGEGGFGAVFVAEQQQPLRRRVALKVIKPGMDTRQVIARFEAERQALALMDHPNIARVLDAGTTASGRPYFVMELVKGVPVTQYCDENRLTPRQRLELFTHVCHAVQHAHHKGIIHRDIKPTNVMVTSHDGTPVVKVIDFGVAKAIGQQLNERTIYTALSQMIGTPLYMSPEQAGMSGLDVDTRTDIYSLGVLLYELLTGTTPFGKERFQQAAYDEIRRIIREEDPPKPSTRLSDLGKCGDSRSGAGELSRTSSASTPARLAGPTSSLASVSALRHTEPAKLTKLVHGELDWIVMKSLDKDRNRRYETANGFALDVQRYLANEPVQACPPSAWYRFRKFARRNKGALMTVAIVGLSLVLGTGISTWQAIRATRAEALADERFEGEKEAREQAVRERDLARRRQFDARLAQAKAGRRSGTAGQRVDSLKAIAEAVDLARELGIDHVTRMDLRNEAIACLGLTDMRLVHEWQGWTPGNDESVCYDSRLEHYARCDVQGVVSVRRIADDQEVGQLSTPERINYEVRFSPDGNLLAALEHTGAAAPLVWDWRKKTKVFQCPHADYVSNAVCFSPDSQLLAVARRSRVVSIFRLATGEEIGTLKCGAQPYHISFSPDGKQLAVASHHQQLVQIHDVATGEVTQKWSEPSGPWGVAWHPNSQLVAVWSNDFRIHLWNAVTGREHSAWQGHVTSTVVHAEFDATGNRLLTWAGDGTTRLWDPWSGRELVQLPGMSSQFSRDGKRLLSNRDGQFLLWEVVGGEEYRSLPNWELPYIADVQNLSARISADGRWLVLGCTNGMRLLDLARNRPVGHFFSGRRIGDVAFHPSGRELLVGTNSGVERLAFALEQDVLRIGPPTQIAAVVVHGLNLDRTGKVLALGRVGGSLLVHLDKPEDPPHRLRIGNNYRLIGRAVVSPDGRWAVTDTPLGAGAQVWDASTGTLKKEFAKDQWIGGMAFSPDGKQLVAASTPAIILWDTETWKEQRRIALGGVAQALGGELQSAAVWDAQGKLFGFHATVRSFALQDPATGQTYATLHAPDNLAFGGARFTPGGDRLVTYSERPSHMRVWDLRLVRKHLAAMGLDWDAPPYDPVDPKLPEPVQLEVELENPAQKAVREKQAEGDTHRVQKEYAQAIACYREVLKSEPHNADVLNQAAWLLAIGPPEVRDGQEALKFMERARAWKPTSAHYVNSQAAAQYRAGQHAEALRSSRQAEKELGDNKVFTWPHNWLVQAMCLAKLGQRDAASAAYQQSVEWLKDPGTRNTADGNEAELLRSEVEALLKQ